MHIRHCANFNVLQPSKETSIEGIQCHGHMGPWLEH